LWKVLSRQPSDLGRCSAVTACRVRTPRASTSRPMVSLGYSDLKTRSTLHPEPANTTRLNRSRRATPLDPSSFACPLWAAAFRDCAPLFTPLSVLPFSPSCSEVMSSIWIAARIIARSAGLWTALFTWSACMWRMLLVGRGVRRCGAIRAVRTSRTAPTLRSVASKRAPPAKQGHLFPQDQEWRKRFAHRLTVDEPPESAIVREAVEVGGQRSGGFNDEPDDGQHDGDPVAED
jgi:hypothetical protein